MLAKDTKIDFECLRCNKISEKFKFSKRLYCIDCEEEHQREVMTGKKFKDHKSRRKDREEIKVRTNQINEWINKVCICGDKGDVTL